jgi:hypothetical protein
MFAEDPWKRPMSSGQLFLSCCVVLLLLSLALTCLAQVQSGRIIGTITYPHSDGGADTLRSGWLRDFGGSLFKGFQVAEGSVLRFRAEPFKLTNTPTFGIPDTAFDTSAGGIVTNSANNPRQLLFALKYNF